MYALTRKPLPVKIGIRLFPKIPSGPVRKMILGCVVSEILSMRSEFWVLCFSSKRFSKVTGFLGLITKTDQQITKLTGVFGICKLIPDN
jgi:hypothetical protein